LTLTKNVWAGNSSGAKEPCMVSRSPSRRANYGGLSSPLKCIVNHTILRVQVEPVEMPFVSPRNNVLDWIKIGRIH